MTKNYSELINSAYPNESLPFCDYSPLIRALGNVVLQVDSGSYSGDSFILYRRPRGVFGFLVFGWGSCSGCDALLSCRTISDVAELMRDLDNQIVWGTAEKIKEHLLARGPETDYYVNDCGGFFKAFRADALALLKSGGI